MRRPAAFAAAFAAVALGCGPDDGRHLADPDPGLTAVTVATTAQAQIVDLDPALQKDGPGGLRLTSPDFSPGSTLPGPSGCQGAESPALEWTPPPRRTQELALVVQDVDGNGNVHWVVTGIPPDVLSVDRGTPPADGEVRTNSVGTATWASPCPQDGFAHRIVFTLYVLDRPLPEGAADTASVVAAIRDTAIGEATLLGRASPAPMEPG